MSDARPLAELLQRIPGWEVATALPLGRGSNNDVYRLDNGADRAVLRVARRERRFPRNEARFEAALQQDAHEAGIAPAVWYSDSEILLSEYASGEPWSRRDMRSDAGIRQATSILRRLHELPPCGQDFPFVAAAEHYAARLVPGTNLATARQCLACIRALPEPAERRRCHNDPVAANFIGHEAPHLIDWEYGGDNSPLFDLAVVAIEHAFTERQAASLLRAYFDAGADSRFDEFHAYCRAYAALAWLYRAATS